MEEKPVITRQFADFLASQLLTIDGELKKHSVITDFPKAVRSALENHHYTDAIFLLFQSLHARQNIVWYKNATFRQHEIIIMDARDALPPAEFNCEPYIIMGINSLRAALDLLNIQKSKTPNRNPELKKIASFLVDSVFSFYLFALQTTDETQTLQALEHFNSVIATHIAPVFEITAVEAKSRLSVVKEYTNLKSKSFHFVELGTRYKNNDKIVIFKADIATTKLTAEQQEEYRQRKQKLWYISLPTWHQEVIDHYLAELLSGQMVLPTQLRNSILGLRNFYLRINGTYENFQINILNSSYHSGTIVYLGNKKISAEEIKGINLLQGKQLNETIKSRVLILTLNTDINPSGNDADIVKNSEIIANSIKGLYVNLPMNFARRVSVNNYSGIKLLLKEIADLILKDMRKRYLQCRPSNLREAFFKNVESYLCSENLVNLDEEDDIAFYFGNISEVKKIIEHVESGQGKDLERKSNILELALVICFIMNNNKQLSDPDNRNLQLACFISILVDHLAYYTNISINISCESGKDRTGVVLFRTAEIVFNRHLYGTYTLHNNPAPQQVVISKNLINASMTALEIMTAGMQTACGTIGLKNDSKGALPRFEFPKEVTKYLFRDCASFNKEIPYQNTATRFYFPIGDTNLEIQKETLERVITVLYQDANTKIDEPHDELNEPEQLVAAKQALAPSHTNSQPVIKAEIDRPSSSGTTAIFFRRVSTLFNFSPSNSSPNKQDFVQSLCKAIAKANSLDDLYLVFSRAHSEAQRNFWNRDATKCLQNVTEHLLFLKDHQEAQSPALSQRP